MGVTARSNILLSVFWSESIESPTVLSIGKPVKESVSFDNPTLLMNKSLECTPLKGGCRSTCQSPAVERNHNIMCMPPFFIYLLNVSNRQHEVNKAGISKPWWSVAENRTNWEVLHPVNHQARQPASAQILWPLTKGAIW